MIPSFSRHIESIQYLDCQSAAMQRCRYCGAPIKDYNPSTPESLGQERPAECLHCAQRYFLRIVKPGFGQDLKARLRDLLNHVPTYESIK